MLGIFYPGQSYPAQGPDVFIDVPIPPVIPDQTLAIRVRARSASLVLDVSVSAASAISGQAVAAPPSVALGLRARLVSGVEDVHVQNPAIARSVKVS